MLEMMSIIALFGRNCFARFLLKMAHTFIWDTSEFYIRSCPEVAHSLPLIRIKFITWCSFSSGSNGCRCCCVRVVKLSRYIIVEGTRILTVVNSCRSNNIYLLRLCVRLKPRKHSLKNGFSWQLHKGGRKKKIYMCLFEKYKVHVSFD